jgi:hypothetical protein
MAPPSAVATRPLGQKPVGAKVGRLRLPPWSAYRPNPARPRHRSQKETRRRKVSRQSFQRKNYQRVKQETIRSRNRNAQSEASSYALRLAGRFLLGLRPLRYTSPSTVSLSVLCSPRSMSVAICAFSDARRSSSPRMLCSREQKMPHARLVTRSTVI